MSEMFYDLEGNEVSRDILVKMMIDYFNELYQTEKTQITDFNEGSEVRNLLESIAVDLYHLEKISFDNLKISFLQYASGEWLDLHGEELKVSRDLGAFSYGYVEFILPKEVSSPVIIPEGTLVVSSENGARFKTNVEVVIPVGDLKTECMVTSLVIGKSMNVQANTVRLFLNNPPYPSLSVNNPKRFTGGRDLETDDEFRERLLGIERQDSFGSLSYYKALASKVDGVHDIHMIDDPTLNPDGSKKYTKKILVNGVEKPTNENVMLEVLSVFTRQNNLVVGHRFSVAKPVYVTKNLELNIYVSTIIPNSVIINRLEALFDGGNDGGAYYEGLNIGQSIKKLKMIVALENLEEVMQVSSILEVSSEGSRTFNQINCSENEVLKLGQITINQEVVIE